MSRHGSDNISFTNTPGICSNTAVFFTSSLLAEGIPETIALKVLCHFLLYSMGNLIRDCKNSNKNINKHAKI